MKGNVSIVIPTRDRPGDLAACLEGLERQTHPELLEGIYVVDDHSRAPPVVPAGLPLTRPLIHLLRNTGRPGAADARNVGARAARGAILGLLDDDSVPATDWLEVIAREFAATDAAAITGSILPLDGKLRLARSRQLRYDIRQENALAARKHVEFLLGGNSALKLADFHEAGGFDADFEMMHDRELLTRLRRGAKRCHYVPGLLVRHRHSKGVRQAMTSAFASGRYRVLMERKHPGTPPWTLRGQIRSYQTVLAAGARRREMGSALLACALESVHAAGYAWHRSSLARSAAVTPVAQG